MGVSDIKIALLSQKLTYTNDNYDDYKVDDHNDYKNYHDNVTPLHWIAFCLNPQ